MLNKVKVYRFYTVVCFGLLDFHEISASALQWTRGYNLSSGEATIIIKNSITLEEPKVES